MNGTNGTDNTNGNQSGWAIYDNFANVKTRSVILMSDMALRKLKGNSQYGITVTELKQKVGLGPIEARKTLQFLDNTGQIKRQGNRWFFVNA